MLGVMRRLKRAGPLLSHVVAPQNHFTVDSDLRRLERHRPLASRPWRLAPQVRPARNAPAPLPMTILPSATLKSCENKNKRNGIIWLKTLKYVRFIVGLTSNARWVVMLIIFSGANAMGHLRCGRVSEVTVVTSRLLMKQTTGMRKRLALVMRHQLSERKFEKVQN